MPVSLARLYQAMERNRSMFNDEATYANLELRATETSSSPPSDRTCGPNACEKPTSSSTFTLPIILGVAVPLVGAAILFLILQRRHTRKQREEDANDRTASLDFGMGDVPRPGRHNASQKKTGSLEEEKSDLSRRQVSMDLAAVHNPYLPASGLNSSRKSLQSLSKSIDTEDPYRPVPQYAGSDAASLPPRSKQRTSSPSAGSARDQEQSNNVVNTQSMNGSQTRHENAYEPNVPKINQVSQNQAAYPTQQPRQAYLPNNQAVVQNGWEAEPSSNDQSVPGNYYPVNTQEYQEQQMSYPYYPPQAADGGYFQGASDNYGYHSHSRSIEREPTLPSFAAQPTLLSDQEFQAIHLSRELAAQDNPPVIQYPNQYEVAGMHEQQRTSNNFSPRFSQGRQNTRLTGHNRISMGFRPLPPDNFIEADDPEVRANRIRSFYKEYFDESTPAPTAQYVEDYQEYYGEEYGSYVPYPQATVRRAITPPLESSRYRSERGINGPIGMSNYSLGEHEPHCFQAEPRPHSSASGRIQPGPRRPIPQPPELNSLPTPAKLKEDALAINPINFAPPSSYKSAGRFEKLPGNLPPFLSIVSGNQELSPMPSPHMLRNSKSFTSLDFAPPRKFKDVDSNSDAGSIRSNRSGMSSSRNRAYSENILPQENLKTSLRPQWDMSGR